MPFKNFSLKKANLATLLESIKLDSFQTENVLSGKTLKKA